MLPCFSPRGKSTLKYGSMYYSNALGLFSSLCKQGALCWVETDGPCVFWTAFLFCICINNWTHGGSSSCGQVESIGHVIRCEDFTLFSVLEGLGSQNIKKNQLYLSTQSRVVMTECKGGSRSCAHQSAGASVCDGDKTAADGLKVPSL